MKAVQIHGYGGPEVLKYEDVPLPQIADDEVLIKIHASGVNPIDCKVRQGLKGANAYNLPLILGWDMSGDVSDLGNKVTEFKLGDPVFGRPDTTRNGTYAEYTAVKASEIAAAPKLLDPISTAGIPLAGLTAWQGIFDHGKLEKGQRILIQGASGGVGSFAIQFAKWKGAYVVGTSSRKNHQFLIDLGANEMLDYHDNGYEKKYSDFDLVFDTVGGQTQRKSMVMLKKGGILVSTLGIEDQAELKKNELSGVRFMAQSTPSDLKEIAKLVDQGEVKVVVDRIFNLPDAAIAHRMIEEGHVRGKIILTVKE
jgi:NADPH:quinone reductase-like Zn-dependent oxidoreductase